MRLISGLSGLPTVYMGDFNEVLSCTEYVSQRCQRPKWQMDQFRQVVLECGLVDMRYNGYWFTWCNNFISPNSTRTRIDRALGMKEWKIMFPTANVYHLSSNHSDHLPILLGVITTSSKEEALILARDIDKLREVDDVNWCQRSKVLWRVKGDKNTAYFHALSAQRNKSNLISTLQDDEGVWHKSKHDICKVTTDFYVKLFSSQIGGNMFFSGQLQSSQFEPTIIRNLDVFFTKEEVKKCTFSISGSKSPWPDGMPAKFFQFYWDTVGDSLCEMVLNFLNDGRFLRKLNFTYINLIPKVERPINMAQFRPIALCNTAANVIAKVLATRLKKVLPSIISDSQSVFVPDRLITDNILLDTRRTTLLNIGNKGNGLGFNDKWVRLTLVYVEPVTYSLLFNGDQVGYIKSGRGLRQEDPLSPYFFIVCTEGLISLLKGAVLRGELKGIKLGTAEEARVIRDILNLYESWSGQRVNLHKSTIQFSPNVPEQTKNEEQLCKSKDEGGLGFRGTQDFNQALLCKQAWRIITKPDSQLSKTFKARYYPDGDFSTTKLGTNPSFTWRSLLSVRDLLYHGIKWELGNGVSVNVWKHNWVQHTSTNKVITPMDETFKDVRVSDLID
ncbi:hypothetical protein LIER_42442 [Lithospermum erythrorhizon]|uniref:Reverse transcriptase domain-containing protein n=1 Tax=Lithospermum erythrorhizon TaxID=34254 RepID=A0AAV3RUZ3_LITER